MRIALSGRLALATAMALLILLAAGASAPGAIKKAPSASKALRTLVKQTSALPKSTVANARRARLLRLVRHARRVAGRRPCSSVRDLRSYRKTLKGTKVKRSLKGRSKRERALNRLATLNASSVAASRSLLGSRKTKRCGGGVKPSNLASTKARVLSSDQNGMKLRVQLAQLQYVPESGKGKSFTKLVAPNTDSPGKPGTPGIPVSSHLLGIPDGAKLDVKTSNLESQTIDGVEVFPAQPEPVDQAPTKAPNFFAPPFTEKAFALDRKAYADKGYTEGPDADSLGQSRDLNIGALQIPAARYDPVKDKLKVIKSVDVQIRFIGGPKTFSGHIGSPWETSQNRIVNSLLNAAVVRRFKVPIAVLPCGEEMLVITNPATVSAANTFANARRLAGFRTSVRQTGAGAGQIGTTNAQIQTFIRGRVNNPFCIRPSYVTIIGDDELVPTFTATPGAIPSDNPYSTKNEADELPDVAVGRIFGNDLGQINAAIAKIIGYETSPPTGPMLKRATMAAQFQDTDDVGEVNDGQEDRTFIQFAETVRNGLVKRGVDVDRIYDDNPSTDPQRFNDGTSLPASLKKPTFKWDGDGADVSAAWNEGRFLVVHRDHGWSDGWGDPFFTTTEVNALTNSNANLPVVMSINCASARYDDDETSFSQNALVKPTGGAVGVFGDTRNSPSWHNSQLALGFVDALLPSVLGSEGPASKQRVGDALIHGKLRLAGLSPPSGPGIAGGDGSTRSELYLWHYFGDPTMQMFGGGSAPIVFNPNVFAAVYRQFAPPRRGDPPPFLVEITGPPGLAGQSFSLLRNGDVIGKAIVGSDGKVQIPATFNTGQPLPGELAASIEADGAARVIVPVSTVPRTPTVVAQSCPQSVGVNPGSTPLTISGTLSGATVGSTVNVTFTPPSGPAQVVQTTTGLGGSWSASVIPNENQLGNWTARASYAGTAQFAPSQAPAACTINVFDNS